MDDIECLKRGSITGDSPPGAGVPHAHSLCCSEHPDVHTGALMREQLHEADASLPTSEQEKRKNAELERIQLGSCHCRLKGKKLLVL